MKAQYSPTPWKRDGTSIVDSDNQPIAICFPFLFLPEKESIERVAANTQLLTAAPELLKACKWALSNLESDKAPSTDDFIHYEHYLKKAIEKAEEAC